MEVKKKNLELFQVETDIFFPEQAHVDENKIEEVRLRAVVATAKKRLPITEGVVEVKYKDGWVQICDLGWTIKNTRVVCGMLGFPHEKKVNKNFYK